MINFIGLFLLLISQTESFTYLSTCPVPGSPREGRVYGDYAYIATSNGGLSIVNVSNVNSPFLVGSCNLSGNGYCLRVDDTIAYVGTADGFTGLHAINVSNPSNPMVISSLSIPDHVWSVVIKNNYAFLAAAWAGLYVVDITDPSNMAVVGQAATTYGACGIDLIGEYAYLASGTFEIFDISNPLNPQRVFYYEAPYPDYATNVVTNDTIAYVIFDDYYGDSLDLFQSGQHNQHSFAESGGMRIFNVKNPPSSTILDFVYTSTDEYGIDYCNDYVITCDLTQGIYLIDVSDPTNAFIEDSNNPGGRCDDVDMDSNYAYIVNASLDLQIFQYTSTTDTSPPQIDSTTIIGDTNYLGPYEIKTFITDDVGLYCTWLVYQRTEDPFFDSVPLINTTGNWYVESIPACSYYGDTVKYYIMAMDLEYKAAHDPEGAPANHYSFSVMLDTSPPDIDSTTIIGDTTFIGPYNIYSHVTDISELDSVCLFYRRIEDPNFRSLVMNPAGDDWYDGEIPNVNLIPDSVCYYIQAWDNAGYQATDPTGAPNNYYKFNVYQDTNPPIFDSTTIWPDTSFPGPYPVHSKITDNSFVDSVCLFYQRIEDPNFRMIVMSTDTANWFGGEIPQVFLEEDSVMYYLQAWDTSGNYSYDPSSGPNGPYCFNVSFDTSGPVIDSTTIWPDTGFAGPYPVWAKIADNNGVDTAVLYYKRTEDVQFFTFPMILQTNSWYQGYIPPVYLDDDSVKYYIWARDSLQNISTDPDSAPLTYYCFVGRSTVGVEENFWIDTNRFSVNWSAVNRNNVVIEMYTPQDTNIAIQIFDLTGRLVENQPELELRTGIHQFVYIPQHRGLYIVKITTDGQSFCKKLMVL